MPPVAATVYVYVCPVSMPTAPAVRGVVIEGGTLTTMVPVEAVIVWMGVALVVPESVTVTVNAHAEVVPEEV